MPYSSVIEAQAYHPAASGQDAKASDVLADAADMVQRVAPAPDPEPSDYAGKAARAERRLFAALWDTGGGYITGSSISGAVSDSFSGMEGVRAIVSEVMGEYVIGGGTGTKSAASYTLGVESSFDVPPLDYLPRA